MQVIHFTAGASDPFPVIRTRGARFVHLEDGADDTHIACLNLGANGRITQLPISHPRARLAIHGNLLCTFQLERAERSGGMGVVLRRGEHCSMESGRGGDWHTRARGTLTGTRILHFAV